MAKYRNKYRIESARLQGWDYRNPGAYFITICTAGRQHFFGVCEKGKMKLSTVGAIVQGFWFEIPKHFEHVRLGEFVVMPNHLHGVLILVEMPQCEASISNDIDVDTNENTEYSDKRNAPNFYRKISPKPGSVSVIMGSYKSVCTKHINETLPDLKFGWQERFYDHIIRDEAAFVRISNYIVNNPLTWEDDRFYDAEEK